MTVDVYELSRKRELVAGRVPLARLVRLASMLADDAGDLDYEFTGEVDERGRPGASLRVRGTLPLRCDLCGQPLALLLDAYAAFHFVADEAELEALPLEDDDEREALVGSRRFDVEALVEDEAILSVPISPRHGACSAALGDDDADEASGRPNPFAALARLKRGEH